VGLISAGHASKLELAVSHQQVDKQEDDDDDDSEGEYDRLFHYEVEKTKEQDEDIQKKPGFMV
jgi:hypothetical protein